MIKLFKITGHSLYPLFKDGQKVCAIRVFKNSKLKINDTVVFEKAPYGQMIKQIRFIENQQYYVQGTNALSMDSRNFGTIDHNEILYKVLFKF